MYAKLKDKFKESKSINCIIFNPGEWKYITDKQYEGLLVFSNMFDFKESLEKEIIEVTTEYTLTTTESSEPIYIDLTVLKKPELVEYIYTNNISDKSKEELSKLKKDELLKLAEVKNNDKLR